MTTTTPARSVGLELVRERFADYGSGNRPEVISLLPAPIGRVLDIGCGAGQGAEILRQRGATELVGIELDARLAAEASRRYDEVIAGSAEDQLTWEEARFDTVLCYDVLEHLYDPWSVMKRIHQLLAPDGRLHVSVPNIRHRSVLTRLAFRGRFTYSPDGVLDVTHIRFFTRIEIAAAVQACGFAVESVSAPESVRPIGRLLRVLTRGLLVELTASQWFVLASRTS